MSSKPTLVIILVDALAASFVQPETMPFLSRLAGEGKKVALLPSPFFAGVDPLLYGSDGCRLGRFTGYCFDEERSPYRDVSTRKLSALNRRPRGRVGKLLHTLWARWVLRKAGRAWMAPQLFPAGLLPRIAPAPPPAGVFFSTHLVHRLEAAGHRARWYTRDFPFEGRKWIGSQLFAWRYGRHLRRWALGAAGEEPPQLVLLELSVELDRLGHCYGPDLESPLAGGLRRVDRQLESLWQAMRDWPRLHGLVVSDHGMSRVECSWDLQFALAKAGLLARLGNGMILSSTLAQFRAADGGLLEGLSDFLRTSGQGNAISLEAFEENQIPADRRWGDVVFVVPEGTLLLPNHFQGRRFVRGMHGYASSRQPSSYPVAVFWGERWKVEAVQPEMPMQEVYPLMLDLFDLGRD